jgi:hypothetical protein
MAAPLSGSELSLEAISSVLADIFTESDTKLIRPEALAKNYATALEKREARLVFESHLSSSQYTESSLSCRFDSWMAYINFEIKEQEIVRAERLYQRALISIQDSSSIWDEAVKFTAFKLANMMSTASVVEKALRLIPNNALCNKLYLLCLDSLEAGEKSVVRAVGKALFSGLESVDDYLDIMLFPCDYYFRQIRKLQTAIKKDVDLPSLQNLDEKVTASFHQVEETLQTYYPEWTVAHLRVCRYHVFVRSFLDQNGCVVPTVSQNKIVKCEIWEELIKRQGNLYSLWSEYTKWAVGKGDHQLARAIFKRGSTVILDFVLEYCREWSQFECSSGAISDILVVYDRLAKLEVKKQSASVPVPPAVSTEDKALKQNGDVKLATKRKLEDVNQLESRADRRIQLGKGDEIASANSESISIPSKMVTVSNLAFNLTEEEIRFSVVKTLEACPLDGYADLPQQVTVCLLLSKANKSRGIVNVHLPTDPRYSVEDLASHIVRALDKSVIHDRIVAALATDDSRAQGIADKIAHHPTTVFVSKLPSSFTEDQLVSLFATCGEVIAAKISVDKRTKESKVSSKVLGFFVSIMLSNRGTR